MRSSDQIACDSRLRCAWVQGGSLWGGALLLSHGRPLRGFASRASGATAASRASATVGAGSGSTISNSSVIHTTYRSTTSASATSAPVATTAITHWRAAVDASCESADLGLAWVATDQALLGIGLDRESVAALVEATSAQQGDYCQGLCLHSTTQQRAYPRRPRPRPRPRPLKGRPLGCWAP